MKTNAELKDEAKRMLQGRWKESILMCLVPTIISILAVGTLMVLVLIPTFFLFRDNLDTIANNFNNDIYNAAETGNGGSGGGGGFISGLLSAFFSVAITWTFLDIFRGQKLAIEPFKDIFRSFKSPYALAVVVIYLLTTIFTVLWTMLFIIPGIVKSYSYSQAYNIFYDTYQNTGQAPKALDTITASRRLMDGHKAQLFILDLSFIGWHILATLTLGIGYLWLTPYIEATKAAFYNNLPKTV